MQKLIWPFWNYMFDTMPCRTEFERNTGLDKKDFAAIEYLLRKGQRQLDIYSSPGIRNITR